MVEQMNKENILSCSVERGIAEIMNVIAKAYKVLSQLNNYKE